MNAPIDELGLAHDKIGPSFVFMERSPAQMFYSADGKLPQLHHFELAC